MGDALAILAMGLIAGVLLSTSVIIGLMLRELLEAQGTQPQALEK